MLSYTSLAMEDVCYAYKCLTAQVWIPMQRQVSKWSGKQH